MAALENRRHELFALAISRGASATMAYVEAGYRGNSANAARLRATPAIQQRLAELTQEAAAKYEITLEGVLRDLDEAVATARAKGHATAMVSASVLKSRLGGLLIDKAEVTINGNTDKFEDCRDFDEVFRTLADSQIDGLTNARWRLITEDDRNYLAGIFQQAFSEAQAFLDSIEARPSHTEQKPIITISKTPFSNGQ